MSINDAILTPKEAARVLKIPLELLLELSREGKIDCTHPETFGIKKTDPKYSTYFRYAKLLLLQKIVHESTRYRDDDE